MKYRILLGALALMLACISVSLAATKTITIDEQGSSLTLLSDRDDGLRFSARVGEILASEVETDRGLFTRLEIPGWHLSKRIGEPELPQFNRLLEIPSGAEARIEIVSMRSREIDLANLGIDNPVLPAQPSLFKNEDASRHSLVIDESLYAVDGSLGAEYLRVLDLGRLRAARIGRLEVAPVRYNPMRGTLSVIEEIEFVLHFEGADRAQGDYLRSATASPFFNCVYGRLAGARSGDRDQHDDHPDLVKSPVTMVVVTSPTFETQLADYVAWKTRRGFNVILAVTGTPEVGSTSSSIQSYLHGLYDAGTPEQPAPSFVLFVGDVAQMPTFTVSGNATDRPYCDVEGDLVPDMYYGRFSATNPTQLQAILDKTLMYEQFAMPDPSYLHEVVMIAGMDSNYGATHGNGQINYGTSNYFNAAHDIYSHTYLYPYSGGNAANIVQNVSDGVSYINYTAHGNQTSWSDPYFSQGNINGLDNYGEYCLAVGNCCLTGSYAVSECFGETWLRASGKGAIGYIGASNNTQWDEDFWWGVGAGTPTANPTYAGTGLGGYDGIFHDHGESMDHWYVTNDALIFTGNLAVMEGGGNYTYYWNIYNLSGDPSLSTWMGTPGINSVSHDAVIPMDATEFVVNAAPGSYVGISKDGVLLGAGEIGAGGSAAIPLGDLGMPGDAEIVVMAQFKEPYFADVTIGYVEQPTCEVNPTSFTESLPSEGYVVRQLEIGNNGEAGSVLYYSLRVDDPILPDRSIAGSTLTPNPSDYTPGATISYVLTVYNASGDYEWLDEVTLDLPTGVNVISSTNFVGGEGGDLVTNGATGDGAYLRWSDENGGWGNVYGNASATATVVLSFTGGAMGDLDIPFTISGDVYGSDPHDISGFMSIVGPSGPTVTLIAPNGGEIWPLGESREILWSAAGGVGDVSIELSRNGGGSWQTLASSVPGASGSFDWTVSGPLSGDCRVRVSDLSSEAEDVSADSFYIHQPVTWLSLPVTEGQCAAGEFHQLDVVFDAAGLADGQYEASIVVSSNAGADILVPVTLFVGSVTAIGETPPVNELQGNYPNPFNPSTSIAFSLAEDGPVRLSVFDVSGRRVRDLVNGGLTAGAHSVIWDGRDEAGLSEASGLYFYRLETGEETLTRKMLLAK